VVQKLKKARRFIKLEKYGFSVQKTAFLGFIISKDSIEMDLEKVNIVLDWKNLKTVKDL